ncbi:MAG: DNA polymerase I [Gaiellaceae bacterium]|jgi:DNA polymerase-1
MSPKDLSGAKLELDDAPARASKLFLVDGNNLAYRAYYALPEDIATSEGFHTNALYGFTSMLLKLLSDYRPRGVAVAWDTRPVHREQILEAYKGQRKPTPDLLREQFPHFRPLVEAFGYTNVEFEGWEADDVIATLATRAEQAGVQTCIVSTDRDAFQLVSDTVCLMMTPRGISEVQVYTPERVSARYGITPEQIPDFIGLKGDTSDNIPGVPGIGEKTASELMIKYGSLEEVLAHASEQTPARRKKLEEFAQQALDSKLLATVRRDLEIDFDATALVSAPPDRSRLKEFFRRYEFRSMLGRLETLDEALPASEEERAAADSVRWREGELPDGARGALAVEGGCFALALEGGVVVGEWSEELAPRLVPGAVVAHDFKSLPGEAVRAAGPAAEDTMIAAYLLDPGRSGYELEELAREQGIELEPEPAAEEETAKLVRRAESTRRLAPLLRESLRSFGLDDLYQKVELPLTVVLAQMEATGVKIDAYRMGEITARLTEWIAELEARAQELAGEPFALGSPQQLGRILFEKLGLTPGRKGKTGYSTDTRVLRSIRAEHEIVPAIEEWRELTKLVNTYLGPLPLLISETDGRLHTTFNQTVAPTGRLSTSNPNLQAIPVRSELGREIRSAFVAEEGCVLLSADYSQAELRILAHASGEEKLIESFRRGEDIHTRTAAEVLGKDPASLTKDERNRAKAVNFGIIYGISAFGLSEQLGISREEAGAYIDAYLARFPAVQEFIARTVAEAARNGYVTTLLGRRRPIPELRSSNFQMRSLGERLAVNTIMQGSAADVIKVAMIAIERRLREEQVRARLVLQIHDELLLELHESAVERTREIVLHEMQAAYPFEPPLVAEAGVGASWAEAK